MTTAGSAGERAVPFGPFDLPRFGRPSTPLALYLWLVIAVVDQCGPLARVIAWIAETWQRLLTSGGVLPSTIAVPPADHRQAATDPEKVLVNALRAAPRMVGTLIRWLVARTSLFPASAVVTMFRLPSHRSTPRYGHRSIPQRINWSRKPELARGSGSRSAIGSKSPQNPGNRDSKINKLAESRDIAAARGSTADRRLFQGEVASGPRSNAWQASAYWSIGHRAHV